MPMNIVGRSALWGAISAGSITCAWLCIDAWHKGYGTIPIDSSYAPILGGGVIFIAIATLAAVLFGIVVGAFFGLARSMFKRRRPQSGAAASEEKTLRPPLKKPPV